MDTLKLCPATKSDFPALAKLIQLSVRDLGRGFYRPDQIEGALGGAWAVDSQLILDRTYFTAWVGDNLAGCGGWSRRKTLFGGDAATDRAPELLDPGTEAARIRAFFIHPNWARLGIGRALLLKAETALQKENFREATLVATLPGVPFYTAFGYQTREAINHPLPNGLTIDFVAMHKSF